MDSLVGMCEGIVEIGDLLTISGNVGTNQGESGNASLAVRLVASSDDKNVALVEATGDIDSVVSGNEAEVIDIELAKILAVVVVVKDSVANVQAEVRWVRQDGSGPEVTEVGV